MLDKYTRTRTTERQSDRGEDGKYISQIHQEKRRKGRCSGGGNGWAPRASGLSERRRGRSVVGCLTRPPSACVSLRAKYQRRERGYMLPRCNSRWPQSVLYHDPFILTNPSWIFYGGERPIPRNHNSPAAAMTPVHSFPGKGFGL